MDRVAEKRGKSSERAQQGRKVLGGNRRISIRELFYSRDSPWSPLMAPLAAYKERKAVTLEGCRAVFIPFDCLCISGMVLFLLVATSVYVSVGPFLQKKSVIRGWVSSRHPYQSYQNRKDSRCKKGWVMNGRKVGDVILSMQGIDKSFPGVHALDHVDFDVRRGEVHALMGENGAGKSTLMKVLTGIIKKDAGTILFEGKAVDFKNPRMAQDAGIVIVHQELNMIGDLTVAQNIFIGREPKGALHSG